MILGGDVGGTKIHLALFEDGLGGRRLADEVFATAEVESPADLFGAFCGRSADRLRAAAFGIAGPVVDGHVRGANLPWEIETDEISRALGGAPVTLVNDLEAASHGLGLLGPDDLAVIQEGERGAAGNQALISPGTGLGEAILAKAGSGLVPVATEGGHADFGPRSDDDVELFEWLRGRFGRVSWERVVSGPGLANVFDWLRETRPAEDDTGGAIDPRAPDAPADISRAALAGRSRLCNRALSIWLRAFGAEAGNLALRALALGGVFLGGGIPPKVLPALTRGEFREEFLAKEPHRSLLEKVPVHVVLNREVALLGATAVAHAVASRESGSGTPATG